MTYTFKLARRLAVARSGHAALSSCLLLAACAGGDQFSSNDHLASTDGLDASARPAGKGKKTLLAVEITPATVTLSPAAPQQFVAAGRYSDGSTRSLSVGWVATGGAVTGSGLYTAGSAVGRYHVIATSGSLADTASVEIVGGSEPPPPLPPPSDAGLANECASPEPGWIWCDDFDQDRLSQYFEYQSAGGSFARAAGVGNEGSYGMRARFAQGQVNAGALHLAFGRTPQSYFRAVDGGTRDYREVYWRLYVRNQPGWVGGGGDKLSRVIAFASSTSWAEAMKAAVWSGGQTTNRDYLVAEPVSGTDAAGVLKSTKYNDFENQRYLGAVRGHSPLFDSAHVGNWYCVEARARWNDPGLANGTMEVWIDGQLDARSANLNWVGVYDEYGMNAVFVENYWNGGSPAAQERYIDNLVVSSEPIGC
jgi:hypothetical protein